jgi:hypothetical protein
VSSPVEDAVGAAPLALCAGDQEAGDGAGAACGLPVSVIGAGDVAIVVESALATAFATAPAPAAVLSLLGSASAAVVVEAGVAQGSNVVVAVVVSTPDVVLPDGARASVAPDVHRVSVAAAVVSVATPVVSAVVVVTVGEGDASVGEADVSVDELELAESTPAAVTSEDVTDTPTVVSAACGWPVASAVIAVSLFAETAVASAEGGAVSTVWTGGVGTSSALAGAIQAGTEAIPTIRTAVQPIRRRSRRRRDGPSNGAAPRMSSVISSLPGTDRLTPRVEYRS